MSLGSAYNLRGVPLLSVLPDGRIAAVAPAWVEGVERFVVHYLTP